MFRKARNQGSVTLTMKRYDGRTKPTPREGRKPLPEPSEYMCLIRAGLKNKKISTVVHPKDVNKFQQAYSSMLKGNLDGLKKLKKTKTKAKATQ
jgi:signal recognition particle subunit SRP14